MLLESSKQKISNSRTQVVLTPTPRAPLDGTPADPQLRAQLDRGSRRSNPFSGVVGSFTGISRTTLKGHRKDDAEVEENSVDEEDYDCTEASPALTRASQGTGSPTLAQSNNTVSYKSEASL
ncbi:hypothetical protein O181_000811 [Austropuccinia psidii MF-1]|uniref:Uncharacterized protein n=1 Tax=Austropuccinia psidii MF-1 TaxID=1389203 RepID=A0A9Q3GBW2_9BASI|nr:hypothetical protein [Austropuccinia psidii MF-1]